MPTVEHATEQASFEQRFHEAVRRKEIAPDIGRISLHGKERRFYEELTSGLAEALKGVVRTSYAFEMNDGRLMARDDEPVYQLLDRGLAESFAMHSRDRHFYGPFLMPRSHHEYSELKQWEKTAKTKEEERGFNTVVTFSPYSEEFDIEPLTQDDRQNPDHPRNKLIKAGQKPQYKRAMLRLAHWDGHQMHIISRSMDNSSVDLLKETALRVFGYKFEADDSTAMLGERIPRRIDDDSWETLLDQATATADGILQERDLTGQVFRQGRPEGEDQDLQKFVESEEAIVDQLISMGLVLADYHSDYVFWRQAFHAEAYKYVALLESKLEGKEISVESGEDIHAQANFAGLVAQAEGKSYDMCGIILNPGSDESVAHQIGLELAIRAVKSEFESSFCPNCLPQGKKGSGKKIKAWRRGDKIGCKNCGHVVDYSDPCNPKVVEQGKKG